MRRLARNRWSLLALPAVLIATVWSQAAEDPPRQLELRLFMRVKLTSSQRVLEGLVTRDFALVDKGATEMREMSQAAKWPRAKDDPQYEHYAAEFRRQCQKLSELAAAENLEGAAFMYSQLTASCVTCHEHVRNSLRPARDPDGPFQLIPTVPTQNE